MGPLTPAELAAAIAAARVAIMATPEIQRLPRFEQNAIASVQSSVLAAGITAAIAAVDQARATAAAPQQGKNGT